MRVNRCEKELQMCRDAYSSRQAQELTGVALTSAMKFETCFYWNTCLVKKNTKKMRELPLVYAERSCVRDVKLAMAAALDAQTWRFFASEKGFRINRKKLDRHVESLYTGCSCVLN